MPDGSTVFWMYHSHVDEVRDVFAGLVGPMIVTARQHARSDGTPIDVDRELVLMFAVTHERRSWHSDRNITPQLDASVPEPGPNLLIFPYHVKFSINGYTHGGLPIESVTIRRGMRTEVVAVEPMEMVTADMVGDNAGTWLIHCHVADHLFSAMQARYRVLDSAAARGAARPGSWPKWRSGGNALQVSAAGTRTGFWRTRSLASGDGRLGGRRSA